MQQAVEPAQVHERAVVGQVLHCAGQDRALFQMFERLAALFADLFFEQLLARNNHVAALLVQLDDADFDVLALVAVEVAHRPHIHLRPGQEGARAQNVYVQAALHAVNHAALDGRLFVERFLDLVPRAQPRRLLVRELGVALFRLAVLTITAISSPAFIVTLPS